MKQINKILKKENVITSSPGDTLSSVLAKLSSSHDAAFVFDENNHFMGVINPYYALIKSSAYDGNTKVEHALFHPPKISPKDSLAHIAQMMNESKIHYLPVFDEQDAFVGITSARRVLALMKEMDISQLKLSEINHTQKGAVITVKMDDAVSQAMNLFKEYKTSKIVVIDTQLKLQGILSYYDLIPYLVAPGSRSDRVGGGERPQFKDTKVRNYAKTTTLTAMLDDTIGKVIDDILMKGIGGVVIVDSDNHPTGIATTKDLLNVLQPQGKVSPIRLTTKNLSAKYEHVIQGLYDFIQRYLQSHPDLREAEIVVNEEKEGVLWTVYVHLIPEKGKMKAFRREGKDLDAMVKDLKSIVSRQSK